MATFLFTDIEGSTRLWEDHPDQMAGVLADHDRLIREAIESHGGRVFSTAGDAFAAVFPSVGAAVEAAVAGQLDTEGLVAGDQPLRVRMAVHLGEVEERDGGFFGSVLNRCARLRDAAHGGQVLVSLAAWELLGEHLPEPITLAGLGEHRLRDLSRPERVFQVCHPDLEADFPPVRSLAGLSTNLPMQVTSFVGRVQESAELEKLVRGSRLVTVTGAGGCGKSRLAVQALMRPQRMPSTHRRVGLAWVGPF
jgi:class 3 adenylate cyclase